MSIAALSPYKSGTAAYFRRFVGFELAQYQLLPLYFCFSLGGSLRPDGVVFLLARGGMASPKGRVFILFRD